MERVFVLAMNMGTLVRCFSGRDGLYALKSLSNWFKDTHRHKERLNVKTQTDLECTRRKLTETE